MKIVGDGVGVLDLAAPDGLGLEVLGGIVRALVGRGRAEGLADEQLGVAAGVGLRDHGHARTERGAEALRVTVAA